LYPNRESGMKAQTVPDARGLVPGIRVFRLGHSSLKTWMAGTQARSRASIAR
jgi:hypothetical protein